MGQRKFKFTHNKWHLKAFFALFLFVFYAHAEAACPNERSNDRYWVADDDGVDKVWHDAANWSSIAGGPGGCSAPNSKNKKAFFNSNSSQVSVKLTQHVDKIFKLNVIFK